jgi:hypothetical protein
MPRTSDRMQLLRQLEDEIETKQDSLQKIKRYLNIVANGNDDNDNNYMDDIIDSYELVLGCLKLTRQNYDQNDI